MEHPEPEHLESPQWTCEACLDDFIQQDEVPIRLEGDDVCKGCVKHLFELALTDEAQHPSRWGDKILHPADFEDIVGKDFVKEYDIKAEEWKVPATYRIYCSCGKFMGSKSYWPTIWCPVCRCGTAACAGCRLILASRDGFIDPHRCRHHKLAEAKDLKEALGSMARGKDYQLCPNKKCQQPIQLEEGCNHMICQPGCGTHFCYRCGKERDMQTYHWAPGGCPLYTATSDHFAAYQEVVEDVTPPAQPNTDEEDICWYFQVWAWNAAMQTTAVREEQQMVLRGLSTEEQRVRISKLMHAHNPASHGVDLARWRAFLRVNYKGTLPWLAQLDAAVKGGETLPTGILQRPVAWVINIFNPEGIARLRDWARAVAIVDDYKPHKASAPVENLEHRRDTVHEGMVGDIDMPGLSSLESRALDVYPGDVWVGAGPHINQEESRKGVRVLEKLLHERTFDTRVVRDNFGLYMRTCSAIRSDHQSAVIYRSPFDSHRMLDWTATDAFNPDRNILQSEDGFVRPRRLEDALKSVPPDPLKLESWEAGQELKKEELYEGLPEHEWIASADLGDR
ncbi:hypothetical protein E2P81_ATG10217 [Venturia nashicola]|nr:hypothetical protein E2P81_ATG10217 [Venturia nashicola]